MRIFNARHKLLIAGRALSLLLLTLALLPKFGFDLPGILKSPPRKPETAKTPMSPTELLKKLIIRRFTGCAPRKSLLPLPTTSFLCPCR